jgi:glycosyltransferase domain-containing protein
MTNAGSDLTIVLTLKDRAAFTLRWMSYANRIALPFKVLIADGGADESVPAMLSARSRFPNVDFEYRRYPYDATYTDYYSKVADALARVRTPYVALADNDDFFIVDGLRKSVEFLAANSDYVACGGRCAGFWLERGAAGAQRDQTYGGRIDWKLRQSANSVTAVSARERMHQQSLDSDHIFYHAFRTGTLHRYFGRIREASPSDLFFMPQLISYMAAIEGRIRQLDTLYLVRQRDSPGSSGGAHQERSGDWWGRMLIPTWSADFATFVDVIAGELSVADDMSIEEARDCVVESYRSALAPSLLSDVLEEDSIAPAMPLVVQLVRRLVRLPESSVVKRAIRNWYRRLRWLSLDAVSGTGFLARPTSNARAEFEPIRQFLRQDQSSTRTDGT